MGRYLNLLKIININKAAYLNINYSLDPSRVVNLKKGNNLIN